MSPALPSPDLLSFDEAAALVAAYAAQRARFRPSVERVKLAPCRRARAGAASPCRQRPAALCALHPRRLRLPGCGSLRASAARRGRLNPRRASSIRPAAARRGMGDHDRRSGSCRSRCRDDAGARRDRQRGPSARTVRLLPPRTIEKGENIVARGAQARKGDELLPAGTAIGAAQIALAAACGCAELQVFVQPARGHSRHRRRACAHRGPRLLPARFATPTLPCWPRWWPRPAASRGFCP